MPCRCAALAAGASDLAGLHGGLLIDFRPLESNGFSVSTLLPGVRGMEAGGLTGSACCCYPQSHAPAHGLAVIAELAIHTNASNGWSVPLRTQPAAGVTMATNGTCGAAMIYRASELFVGDAFCPCHGGRVQFAPRMQPATSSRRARTDALDEYRHEQG
jgi:hypothetical protein